MKEKERRGIFPLTFSASLREKKNRVQTRGLFKRHSVKKLAKKKFAFRFIQRDLFNVGVLRNQLLDAIIVFRYLR